MVSYVIPHLAFVHLKLIMIKHLFKPNIIAIFSLHSMLKILRCNVTHADQYRQFSSESDDFETILLPSSVQY